MKKGFSISFLILSLFISTFSQDISRKNPFTGVSVKQELLSTLKYAQFEEEDTSFSFSKLPSRAFLLSAILPGAGEFYAGAKWRALIFGTVEVASWALYIGQKNKGERLEDDYLKYADNHWDLDRWFSACEWNDFNKFTGSHHIWINYTGSDGVSTEFEIDDQFQSVLDSLTGLGGIIEPLKTRDYYENIGKYDQFSGGWQDFEDFNTNPDTAYMTDLRDSYLTQREKSNRALKTATGVVTVIMFNHLISAFDAVIAAKNAPSREESDISWHVGLISDYRYKNPVRGLQLSVLF